MTARRKKILIVYASFPTRASLIDSLYSFRRYCDDEVFYLNLRLKNVPRYIRKITFDLVIFHTLFFALRHDPASFRQLIEKASPLAECGAVKAMLPQDEFVNSKGVNEFIRALGIEAIFSLQPESEWTQIYDSIDLSRVKMFRVLAGYLDGQRVRRIAKFSRKLKSRPLDIGYRTAGRPPAWFGRHGLLKQQIADIFAEEARKAGLKIDISTSAADTLLGDSWYKFLCRCKYTLGVEGGTSVLDVDGTIKQKTEEYCSRKPSASFEEVEEACFTGLDRQFHGYAISPRHLEACATRTCQVLTEGEYNGILFPGKHYIPLKQDFSNVKDVLEAIVRDDLRERITETAFQDIVQSEKYSYKKFVDFVVTQSLEMSSGRRKTKGRGGVWERFLCYRMRLSAIGDRVIGMLHRWIITPGRQRLFGR